MDDKNVMMLLQKIRSEIIASKSMSLSEGSGADSISYNHGCDVSVAVIDRYSRNEGLYQLGDAGKNLKIGD